MGSLFRNFLIGLLVCVTGPTGPDAAGDDRSESARQRRHRRFLEDRGEILNDLKFELAEIRDWCGQQGLTDTAVNLTDLTDRLTTDDSAAVLPVVVGLPVSPALPEPEQQWRERVRNVRTGRAREIYRLARSVLRAGLPSLAYQLVQDTLRVDPDHRNARAILGQQLFHDPLRKNDAAYAGEWVSPFETKLRGGRPPHIYDERFGWIPRKHLARYESGERPWGRKWISKEKETELRRDFGNAWEIRSEHFLIRTNAGLEEGVLLSRRLELFYSWLKRNFVPFFDTPEALRERFDKAHVRGRTKTGDPMEVHYFATRFEYQREIRGKIPPNIVTNGLYWEPDRKCYFFREEDGANLSTLYHEATHQILDIPTTAARRTAARALARKTRQRTQEWILGGQSGFWLIEGLACYFESFEVSDGVVSVGRRDFVRFVAAQQRLLRDDLYFYLPLQTFCRLGKEEFQNHPNVAQLYSQASGLVHFMMHYDSGRYRDDLVALLCVMYRPDPRQPLLQPSLAAVTRTPFGVLDQQYRDHMEQFSDRIRAQPASRNVGY